ncbi:Peptidase inhibitor 16 [Vulpes lagopus]
MHSSCDLLLLLLLLLAATVGPAGALTEDEKRAMVELHNLYRSQASPPAADMLQMRWNEELAAFAKAYAKQCVWGHNKERGRRGENLFAITGHGLDVPLAMEEWHHEREHYNLSAATCDQGQMCGHYTQVVWAKTDRIGCGSHFCEKLQGVEETNIHLLVCNYEPPGNVKGKKPYEEGTPCSLCPSGYRCESSLCEPIAGQEEAQDLPGLVTEAPSSLATEASGSGKKRYPFFPGNRNSSLLGNRGLRLPGNQGSTCCRNQGPIFRSNRGAPLYRNLFSLDEGPATSPKSTHEPISKLADKEASRTRMPSKSPESSPHPKMFLTGTREPLPQSQKVGKAEAKLSPSSEVLASVFPGQDKTGELLATWDHMGHTSSKSLSNSPNTSASAKATRTLALQSSLPGAEGPEKPSVKSGLNLGPGHIWGPLLGLLLLLPLVLAGIF